MSEAPPTANLATEQEAKGRWCHQTFRPPWGVASADMVGMGVQMRRCVGGACMAWRWRGVRDYKPGSPPETWEHTGYCGLAGSPP